MLNTKDQSYLMVRKILYKGKLLREKTFAKFVVLWLFMKVFSAKFGGVASFPMAKESNQRNLFFVFLTNSRKFSPSKVPAIQYIVLTGRKEGAGG